jgi:hypothetical protein
MTKDLRLGVSLSEDRTQLAIIEFRPDGADVKYLEEVQRPAGQALTFLPDETLKAINSFGKLSRVNVSIETGNGILQMFPLDAGLSQTEQEEHLDWEWKNYLPEYSPSEYLRTTRVLVSNKEQQTNLVLSSIVKQSLLKEIKDAFIAYKLPSQSVELMINAAENVLRYIHMEMKIKNVALLGISQMRLDVYVFENGKFSSYKYGLSLQPQTAVDFLAGELLEFLPETLYVFGSALSYEWQKMLKSSLGVVLPLNPFRKFRITHEVKNFSKFLGHEHRFCGCVGSILDSESIRIGK